jgi:thermitase
MNSVTARVEGFDLQVHGGAPEARAVADFYLGGAWHLEPGLADPQQYDIFDPIGLGRSMDIGDAWEIARKMTEDPRVIRAEPLIVTTEVERLPSAQESTLESALPPRNWHIEHCAIHDAWTVAKGENVVIGHPDTGYMKHSEIWSDDATQNRVLHEQGFDFVENRVDALVRPGGSTHGTATASVIMSSVAEEGVHGVAPAAKLIPIRVDNDVVHWRWGRVRKAIEFATNKDVDIISMSLGGPIDGESLRQAVRRAVGKGIIVVAAAGNGWRFVVYPAKYPEVLAVAATNASRQKWGDSARGSSVAVCAPGEDVYRATFESDGRESVARSSGTSYATAIVAGVAALWLSRHGRANLIATYGAGNVSSVFRWVVMNQGVRPDADWDTGRLGAGIIDGDRVVRAELPDPAIFRVVLEESVPQQHSRFAEIAEYFPDVAPDELYRALVQMLHTTDTQLESELERFGNELKLHVATNPEMRARLSGGMEAMSANESVAMPQPSLSRSLRAKMQMP